MRTALDASPEALDVYETRFVDEIRKNGWFRTHVPADDGGAGFSYTTGLWASLGAPELIVFSLESRTAHDVFWNVYRSIHDGASLQAGRRVGYIFQNADAVLLPVSRAFYPDHLGWTRWFYGGDDWPCLQLIWPDVGGAFPWEAAYDKALSDRQPNLTGRSWPSI